MNATGSKACVLGILGVLTATMCGCASRMVGTGPYPADSISERAAGIIYHLPKDVLIITGVAYYAVSAGTVERIETPPEAGAGAAGEAAPRVEFRVRRRVPEFRRADLDYAVETIADGASYYRLNVRPGWFGADSHAVDLSPLGVISSADAKAQGHAGEVLRSVSAMAGNAVGIGASLGGADSEPHPMAENIHARMPANLPLADQFYYSRHPEMLEVHETVKALAAERDRILHAQIAFTTDPPPSTAGAVVKERIEAFRAAKLDVDENLARASEPLAASKLAFFRAQGLVSTELAKPFVRRFELSEIPSDEGYRDASTLIEVEDRLDRDGYVRMQDCLRELRAYLTLEPRGLPEPREDAAGRESDYSGSAVYYRLPVPITIRVYAQGQDIQEQSMEGDRDILLSDVREHALLHPRSRPTALPIVPSLWTERKATFTADGNLRPKRLTWTTGSAASESAVALDDSIAAFRDEAVKASEKLSTFRKSMRSGRLADLEDEIAETDRRHELLEVQIELQGTVATEAQQVRLAELKAQSKILSEQVAIEKSLRALEEGVR